MRAKRLVQAALATACAVGLTVAGAGTANAATPSKGKLVLTVNRTVAGEKAGNFYVTYVLHHKVKIAAHGTYSFGKAKSISLPKGSNYSIEVDSSTKAVSAKTSSTDSFSATVLHRAFKSHIAIKGGKTTRLTENSAAFAGLAPSIVGIEVTTPQCTSTTGTTAVTIGWVTNYASTVYISASKTSDPAHDPARIGGAQKPSGLLQASFDCASPYTYYTIGTYKAGWKQIVSIQQVFRQPLSA